MEFASRKTTNANVGSFFVGGFLVLSPGYAYFGGKLSNIFVIFKISPELNFCTWFF